MAARLPRRLAGCQARQITSRRALSTSASSLGGQNTKYPLYPAVTALIHENHIPKSEIAKIPATGPNGRLLKGDVLSYLGHIGPDYSSAQSKRIQHLAHLDLSNVKIAPIAEKKPESSADTEATSPPEVPAETLVALPISLTEVLRVQKRVQDTLGVSMPLSTFLARAVDLANDDLPKSKGAGPSPNDLFNAVLGLNSIPQTSRGAYVPQITALPTTTTAAATANAATTPALLTQRAPRRGTKVPDIIDVLAGKASTKLLDVATRTSKVGTAATASAGAMNLFSITVPVGEEKRARTFLERVKTVLQVEPGRLVL